MPITSPAEQRRWCIECRVGFDEVSGYCEECRACKETLRPHWKLKTSNAKPKLRRFIQSISLKVKTKITPIAKPHQTRSNRPSARSLCKTYKDCPHWINGGCRHAGGCFRGGNRK